MSGSDPCGAQFEGLAKGGLKYGLWVWECDQGAATWQAFLVQAGAVEDRSISFGVKFTPADVRRADWAFWQTTGFTGYPQPQGTYKQSTYDRAGACDVCDDYADGKRQIAPFRMRGEPPLGRRSIMQLHWVPDAWFVTRQAYEVVFAPFGIAARPALTKGGRELKSVVQLVIEEFVPVDEYRIGGQICDQCETFRPSVRLTNYAPAPLLDPTGPLAFTTTTYGSGAQNFHETLVRRDLREAITAAGLRGTRFHPCGSAEARRDFQEKTHVPAELMKADNIVRITPWRPPGSAARPNLYETDGDSFAHSTSVRTTAGTDASDAQAQRARRLLAQTGGLATPAALVHMGTSFYAADALDDALTAFGRAAQAGHPVAMSMTAHLLKDDDPVAAEQWWRRAIEAGSPSARCDLGLFLHEAGRVEEAQTLWEAAVAHDNDEQAMVALAILNWDTDLPAVRRWLTTASERNHAHSSYLLGVIARDVDGDPLTAQRQFKKAAEGGDADAIEALTKGSGGSPHAQP